MPTMDEKYRDGSDHKVCELCGFCKDCDDCECDDIDGTCMRCMEDNCICPKSHDIHIKYYAQ